MVQIIQTYSYNVNTILEVFSDFFKKFPARCFWAKKMAATLGFLRVTAVLCCDIFVLDSRLSVDFSPVPHFHNPNSKDVILNIRN